MTKNSSKFSEPYDNPFWEKSNNGRKKARRLMLKIVACKILGTGILRVGGDKAGYSVCRNKASSSGDGTKTVYCMGGD